MATGYSPLLLLSGRVFIQWVGTFAFLGLAVRLLANQGWGQVQLVKYSSTSSTRNQVQVQVQVL